MLPSSLLKFLRVRNTPKAESQAACQKACLAFSDTQIVTGISILIAGFAQIRDISVYHFNIVAYMGWLASNVHVSRLAMYAFRNRIPVLFIERFAVCVPFRKPCPFTFFERRDPL